MLKSYASYFVSFLLDNLQDLKNIKQIILFGSVAKNESTKESDVDIFMDVYNENKKFEEKINKITENFYKSREALIFKSKNIDNKINVIVGKLEKWKELKASIESTGIVLFGRYISSSPGIKGKKQLILSWDKINKNRGAFLNKIHGFKVNGKSYKGLVETLGGKKIGKSSILIPIENKDIFLELLKKYKVNAKILEVYA